MMARIESSRGVIGLAWGRELRCSASCDALNPHPSVFVVRLHLGAMQIVVECRPIGCAPDVYPTGHRQNLSAECNQP